MEGRLQIFTGNAHPALAAAICRELESDLGRAMVSKFANGETRVKLDENVRGADVFVIQPTSEPVNDYIMELLLMIDSLRRASAARITAPIASVTSMKTRIRFDRLLASCREIVGAPSRMIRLPRRLELRR